MAATLLKLWWPRYAVTKTVDMCSDEGDHRKVGVQPACEQSLGAGHAYTATLDIRVRYPGGGLGLIPSLVVGEALPFSSSPIENGSGLVSSLCSRY